MGSTLGGCWVREQKGRFGSEARGRLLSNFYHLFAFIVCVQLLSFAFLDRLRSSICFHGVLEKVGGRYT